MKLPSPAVSEARGNSVSALLPIPGTAGEGIRLTLNRIILYLAASDDPGVRVAAEELDCINRRLLSLAAETKTQERTA